MASKGNNVLTMYIICCREGKYLEKRKIANIFEMGYHFSYRDGKTERFRKNESNEGKNLKKNTKANKKHDSDNNFAAYGNVILGILLRKERHERKKFLENNEIKKKCSL